MGGSSLAPDILRRTFGTTEGYLELRILDSTDPAYVHEVLDDLDPLRTLVIIASKSGTTTEPNAFLAYAWARAEAALAAVPHHRYEHPGAYFALITDPGKSDAIKNSNDFREIFLNPPDIGGRYSALTYVGLVPASLIGVDLDPLLAAGAVMLGACHEPDPALNPGLSLGHRHRDAGQGRPRQADVPDRRRDRELRGVGGAAHRREHGQARRRHRPRRPRAARRGRGVRRRPDVRPDRAGGARPGRARHARGRARGGRPPGHPDRAVGPDRPRRGGRPLGGRHGHRRDRARHRPVRPAQRRGGQAADPRRRSPRSTGANARPTQTGADRERRRPRPVRRRGPPADRRRRRRRGRAPAPPGAAPPGCLPVPAGLHRPDRRARRRPGPDPLAAPRPDRPCDDRRLRPALPPLDRPAAQGRRPDRLVHPADRRITRPTWTSRAGRTASASSSTPRRRATSRRSSRTTCRSSGSTSAPTRTPGWPRSSGRWRPPSNQARRPDQPCASGSSAWAGWGPTWSAGWSATVTRS